MPSVSLQIVAGELAYVVRLIEETGETTEGRLLREEVMNAAWPPKRILECVGSAGRANRNDPQFRQIAETLNDWLFPVGAVRDRWADLDARLTPRVLLDIQVEELRGLPWELASKDFLALTNGMYRLTKTAPVQPQASLWPFRILLVVGAPAEEQDELGIAAEIVEIERTFLPLGRSVDVQRLDRPDKDRLKDWVRSFHPHVFHFAGHGGKLPGATEGGLRFDPPGQEPWVWSGGDIRADLKAWHWTPRFVFLNACRSAVEAEGNRSVQRGFLDRGVQAVLGMQADISGELAGQFAAKLYSECVKGSALEDAVFEARLAISAKLPSNEHIDWALPVLACSAPGFKLVERQVAPATPEFTDCREFVDARFFSNCREPRREFTHWLYPADTAGARTRNVLLVTGESRSGKSHLLKWCMETWALGGARVRYIELHEQSRTFLDILRQIRKGETVGSKETRYLHEPLPPAAFKRFQWELKNILEKSEPGEWIEGNHLNDAEIGDDDGVLPSRSDKRLEPMVCGRFWAGLKAAAGARPLVLVFDRLGGTNNERAVFAADFEQLILNLFLPIARDSGSNIKLAFGATFSERRDYNLDRLAGDLSLSYVVPVNYPDERLVELAAEAVFFERETEVKALARAMLSLPDDERALGLGRLKSFIEYVNRQVAFHGVRMR